MLNIEGNKKEILDLLRSVNRMGMQTLLDYLERSTFFSDPASAKNHNNEPGGLADHSLKVYKICKQLCKLHNLDIPNESIIIACLLHDLCKIGTYNLEQRWKKDKSNKWQSYMTYVTNKDASPICPHGSASALIASRYIPLKDIEESAIAWHMGAYGLCQYYELDTAYTKNPLALLVHHADMQSANLHESHYAMDEIPIME